MPALPMTTSDKERSRVVVKAEDCFFLDIPVPGDFIKPIDRNVRRVFHNGSTPVVPTDLTGEVNGQRPGWTFRSWCRKGGRRRITGLRKGDDELDQFRDRPEPFPNQLRVSKPIMQGVLVGFGSRHGRPNDQIVGVAGLACPLPAGRRIRGGVSDLDADVSAGLLKEVDHGVLSIFCRAVALLM